MPSANNSRRKALWGELDSAPICYAFKANLCLNTTNKKAIVPHALSFSIHIRVVAGRQVPLDTERPIRALPARNQMSALNIRITRSATIGFYTIHSNLFGYSIC